MGRNIPANVPRELGDGALLGMGPAAYIQKRQGETSTGRGQGSLETPQAEKPEDLQDLFTSVDVAFRLLQLREGRGVCAASQRQSARAARTKTSLCLSVQARLNVYERRSAVARSAS